MVVQTTFPVPSVIDAQRCTSQPLHQFTPPWPRTTTRKSLPVNNDSTRSNGVSTSSLRGMVASHVWSHRRPYITSRDSGAMRRIKGCLVIIISTSTGVSRQGGRVMSYLGHYVTGYSAIAKSPLPRSSSI